MGSDGFFIIGAEECPSALETNFAPLLRRRPDFDKAIGAKLWKAAEIKLPLLFSIDFLLSKNYIFNYLLKHLYQLYFFNLLLINLKK